MDKTIYVVGFLFNAARDRVVLIQKQRPNWQRGHWNGIGGHVMIGEEPHQAMRREFLEETGTDVLSIERFYVGDYQDHIIHFFRAFDESAYLKSETMTDEGIAKVRVDNLPDSMVRGLNWLIPMALDSAQPAV